MSSTTRRDLTGFGPKAQAWRAFFETSARVTTSVEKQLQAETGLKLPEYNVLLALAEAPENRLRMGELAKQLIFSPSRLSYQVKTLAAQGLIIRTTDAQDKRGATAELTDVGREAFRVASAVHASHVRKLFHPALNDDEAQQLAAMCQNIMRHTCELED